MGKYEADMTREDILKETNMTLEEYESGVLPVEVAVIVLYEALVTSYNYINRLDKE